MAINDQIQVVAIWDFTAPTSLCMLDILHNRKIKICNTTEGIFVHKSLPVPQRFPQRRYPEGNWSKLGTILRFLTLPDKPLTKICCTNLLLERQILDKQRRVRKVFQEQCWCDRRCEEEDSVIKHNWGVMNICLTRAKNKTKTIHYSQITESF